jgi:hypothetical protein
VIVPISDVEGRGFGVRRLRRDLDKFADRNLEIPGAFDQLRSAVEELQVLFIVPPK